MKTLSTHATFSQNFLVWDDKKFHLSPSSSLSFQVFLIIIQGVRCPKGSITLAICIHFPSLSSIYVFFVTWFPYNMKVFISMQYSQLSLMTQAPNKSILCLHMGFIIHFNSLILLSYFHYLVSMRTKSNVK